jgi:glucosamine 6-phosphate synthetase-like amidotransferase/phosphosugar isomerase protein
VEEWLSPFVQVVPVQLLSYYVALERACNPDTGREDQPAHARAREHYKL